MERGHAALILVVGNDTVLLKTRAAVLRVSGFKAITAQGIDQARMTAGYFAFNAALLCHTLTAEERDALALDLGCHAKCKTPIMKLYTQQCQPASLIASVRELVGRSREADPAHSMAPHYELASVKHWKSGDDYRE